MILTAGESCTQCQRMCVCEHQSWATLTGSAEGFALNSCCCLLLWLNYWICWICIWKKFLVHFPGQICAKGRCPQVSNASRYSAWSRRCSPENADLPDSPQLQSTEGQLSSGSFKQGSLCALLWVQILFFQQMPHEIVKCTLRNFQTQLCINTYQQKSQRSPGFNFAGITGEFWLLLQQWIFVSRCFFGWES